MIFKAEDTQIIKIIRNAINNSIPMGMGVYHYKRKNYTSEELEKELMPTILLNAEINIDYFEGRMVKLYIKRVLEKDTEEELKKGIKNWEISDRVDTEYQSWGDVYPTIVDIVNSVKE